MAWCASAADQERETPIVGTCARESHLRANVLAGTLVFLASAGSAAMSGQAAIIGMSGFYYYRQ
jgi:hypothetical protein